MEKAYKKVRKHINLAPISLEVFQRLPAPNCIQQNEIYGFFRSVLQVCLDAGQVLLREIATEGGQAGSIRQLTD